MKKSFKYNGKIWNPKDPEKKLKQLGITWDDVEIIEQSEKLEEKEEFLDPNRLFYYLNKKTGYSITSIHPNLQVEEYEPTTYEELKKLWNK